MTSQARIRSHQRSRNHPLQLLLRALGQPVTCTECGGQLFRALTFVKDGRINMIRTTDADVRVAFYSRDSLEFRHLELAQCRTPDRPWARADT
jgi:hypothetical protein